MLCGNKERHATSSFINPKPERSKKLIAENKFSKNASRPLHYFRWILLAIVVGFLTYNLYCHRHDLTSVRSIDTLSLLILAGLMIVFNYLGAIRFSLLYYLAGAKVGTLESFALSLVATMANILFPGQAGGLVRAVYLKRMYGVTYSKIPAILLGSIIVTLFVGGVLVSFANILVAFGGVAVPPILWAISACASASILFFWIRLPSNKFSFLSERLRNILGLFFSAWEQFMKHKTKLVAICICQLLSFFVSGACAWITYRALGINIALASAIVLMAATTILSPINIVPGNLGVSEIIIAYFSSLFGISFTHAVIAALIIRGTSYLVILPLGSICYLFLSHRKSLRLFNRDYHGN